MQLFFSNYNEQDATIFFLITTNKMQHFFSN